MAIGVKFNATIDKDGNRSTFVEVEIEENDILALHGALIEHYQSLKASMREIYDVAREIPDSADPTWKYKSTVRLVRVEALKALRKAGELLNDGE